MLMNIQNLVLFCQFILKILSKNQILTSIEGRNSVANLRKKTKIYNTNVDLVNDIAYTKFGLNLFIRSQLQGQLLEGVERHIYLYCFTFDDINLNRALVIIVLFPTKYSNKKVCANDIRK